MTWQAYILIGWLILCIGGGLAFGSYYVIKYNSVDLILGLTLKGLKLISPFILGVFRRKSPEEEKKWREGELKNQPYKPHKDGTPWDHSGENHR